MRETFIISKNSVPANSAEKEHHKWPFNAVQISFIQLYIVLVFSRFFSLSISLKLQAFQFRIHHFQVDNFDFEKGFSRSFWIDMPRSSPSRTSLILILIAARQLQRANAFHFHSTHAAPSPKVFRSVASNSDLLACSRRGKTCNNGVWL